MRAVFLTCSPKTCKSCTFHSAGTPTDTRRPSANNISVSPRSRLFYENRIISENENGSEFISPSSIIAKHVRRVRFFDRHQMLRYVPLFVSECERIVRSSTLVRYRCQFDIYLCPPTCTSSYATKQKSNKINCFSQLRLFCQTIVAVN